MKTKSNEHNAFEGIVMERYAVKMFDGKKVPESILKRLFELIRFAPSSFNIQPWKILVVEDDEVKEKLSVASWGQPQVKSCSHLLVFCANKDVLGSINRLENLMLKNEAQPESIKGYIQMMRDFEKNLTDEQRLSWAQRQSYLALGNALNGAKSLGFDSCPMEGFDPKAYSEILNLPENIVPTALCPIGYASDKQGSKLRFDESEVFQK